MVETVGNSLLADRQNPPCLIIFNMSPASSDHNPTQMRRSLANEIGGILAVHFPRFEETKTDGQMLGLVCGFTSGRDSEDRFQSWTQDSLEWRQVTLDETDIEILGLSFEDVSADETSGCRQVRLHRYRDFLGDSEADEANPDELDHGYVVHSLPPISVAPTDIIFGQYPGTTSAELGDILERLKQYQLTAGPVDTAASPNLYTVAYQADWGLGTLNFLALQDDDDIRAALGALADWPTVH